MDFKNLSVIREGRTAVIAFARPDAGNALSVELMRELETAALGFRDDVETRAVIVTGEGKHFSVGVDLKDPEQVDATTRPVVERRRRFELGPRVIRALREMDQVTVAAINGIALGGGACIASALDFRIGSAECLIGYPESSLAIPLSWVSLPLCVHLVGPARAKRWLMTGEKLPAGVLKDWGFLDEVVPPGELAAVARGTAEAYAARPPLAVQMIKRSVNALVDGLDRAIMHMDTDQVLLAQTTGDFREGALAFLEKRDPEFRGR